MIVPDSASRVKEGVIYDAYTQLKKIQDYITEHFPLDFGENDDTSDTVIKLLGRYRAEQSISLASEAIFGHCTR